ncbi:MAG TPA: hypothetical protein VK183_05380 [Flavobacterium sp.]|nr:hypothetical protein [Flavobacterium sp.]
MIFPIFVFWAAYPAIRYKLSPIAGGGIVRHRLPLVAPAVRPPNRSRSKGFPLLSGLHPSILQPPQ